MSRKQNISWNVQNEDLSCSPLCYEVELGESPFVYPKSIKHRTVDGTGEFEVSLNGGKSFVPYPQDGIRGATINTIVRMLTNGENPTSAAIVGKDSFLYKMSLDCNEIILKKKICESGVYTIDSISCDNSGKIWVKDSCGVITVLDRQLKVLNTFNVSKNVILAVVDPLRRLLWTVSNYAITVTRTEDMSIVTTALLPTSIYAVTDWEFSGPSGTLFMILDNSTAISVTKEGIVTTICTGATGLCQMGARGALICLPNYDGAGYFDGSSIVEFFTGSRMNISNPARISNFSNRGFIVSNAYGTVVKTDLEFNFKWNVSKIPLRGLIDVKTTQSSIDLGGIFYLSTSNGIASYRDLSTRAVLYGYKNIRLPSGRSPSAYPIISVIPELKSSHLWAKIIPTEHHT